MNLFLGWTVCSRKTHQTIVNMLAEYILVGIDDSLILD
jgi:hypothetical protein